MLIVDDDDARRNMLATYFRHATFEVVERPDGQGLVELVRDSTPDVILLDVMLPGESGVQLTRKLRTVEAVRATPIILMTASSTDEDSIVTGLTSGADDYIVTPARLAEINARVRVQLRNRRERQALQSALHEREKLVEEATRDALTGIPNRRHCDRELSRIIGEGTPFLLVLLDVDYFKKVNDTHGHLVGDAVLKEIAATLSRAARRGDLVARFGGEEFAVVAAGAGLDVAEAIGERFRRAVEVMVLPDYLPLRSVTISVGVASSLSISPPVTQEKLSERADAALYQAKRLGRNRVVVSTE